MNKDWLLDVAATITALFVVGIFIELLKGKLHRWGEEMHGCRADGSHRKEYPYAHPKHSPKGKPKEEEPAKEAA